MTLGEIAAGDEVVAYYRGAADQKPLLATSLVVRTKADLGQLAQKQVRGLEKARQERNRRLRRYGSEDNYDESRAPGPSPFRPTTVPQSAATRRTPPNRRTPSRAPSPTFTPAIRSMCSVIAAKMEQRSGRR